MIGDGAVVAEDHEAVEAAQEPAVVGDGDHRAVELGQAGFERLGGHEVEVVGRLVEQEEVAPERSSRRIWKRACWPPDSVSNGCSAHVCSS